MPHSITDILEGESLVNDATGLVALQFGIDMIVDRTVPTFTQGAIQFLWLLGGGIAVGLLIGWLVTRIERFVHDAPVDIVLSILVAYLAYLAGEAVHASGVIAVVACGLFLSLRSDTLFSPQTRLQIWGVWEAFEFLLNGLVFLLIGLQLPYVLEAIQGYSLLRLVTYGLVFSLVLIALRLIWVYPSLSFASWLRTRLLHHTYVPPNPKASFVLGWTGMRGVLALAAAGSLPATIADGSPFPQRNMILFLTFAVILVTLVLQGLTLPATVRALGFDRDTGPAFEENEARRLLLQAAIHFVETQRDTKAAGDAQQEHHYDDLLHQFQHRMEDLSTGQPGASQHSPARTTLLDAYRAERDVLVDLRATGRIGDTVYRTLQRELDLIESRLDSQQ
jgi:CPA1 family monovalent cation:H+ antiporter